MFKVGSIFIPVTDVKKSSEWYEKYLGAKEIDSWEDGAGFYLPTGSTQLALVKVEFSQPTEFFINESKKKSYYNFVVDDIEAAYQHFNAANITTTEIDAYGDMKFFDFFDLDGNLFSVVNEVTSSPYHSQHIRQLQENEYKGAGS